MTYELYDGCNIEFIGKPEIAPKTCILDGYTVELVEVDTTPLGGLIYTYSDGKRHTRVLHKNFTELLEKIEKQKAENSKEPNYQRISLKFHKENDSDILDYINGKGRQTEIKRLIRLAMAVEKMSKGE